MKEKIEKIKVILSEAKTTKTGLTITTEQNDEINKLIQELELIDTKVVNDDSELKIKELESKNLDLTQRNSEYDNSLNSVSDKNEKLKKELEKLSNENDELKNDLKISLQKNWEILKSENKISDKPKINAVS